jgi:ubiquinone/menaquinone biosynthesis C-methylase UbiE
MSEFYNVLKKGGKFLLHTDVSPEMFESGKYKFNEERRISNGRKLLIKEAYNIKTKRIEGSWTLVSINGVEKLAPYSVRIYTKDEFEVLAKKVGFKKVQFYGSFNGAEFSSNSSELIMVAEK